MLKKRKLIFLIDRFQVSVKKLKLAVQTSCHLSELDNLISNNPKF